MRKCTSTILLLLLVALVSLASAKENLRPKRFFDDAILEKHQSHSPVGEDADRFLTIHLIPHSHDDVGWLKTVDQYYYGADQSNQWAGVQYTIDTVLDELLKNPKRKFIQVETAFLYRWWIDSPEERHQQYRKLVQNGQIEFVNGGWCMQDEATPYYEDIIDQMTVGHQWLLETFGAVPTTGWHIDPFGHQATNAALFSQMGFNGWWFARIDYQDKDKRLSEKAMEMVWTPYQASSVQQAIFSAVNYNHYNPPNHFNFDLLSTDEPMMDNPHLEGFNIDWKADEYVSYFRNMSAHFRSDHLLHTIGEDFNYANALQWYKNQDKLMDYINARSDLYRVRLQYSTPSIYLSELQKQNLTFPTKTDDFFPYADQEYAYWTGYFTSRVALKGNVRDVGRYLQHVRNIFSSAQINGSQYLTNNYELFLSKLTTIEQNMAILQHHDAVAGTEKQYVAYDYVYRLQNSTDSINSVLFPVLQEATLASINETVNYSTCRWNSTSAECPTTYENLNNNKTVLLAIHNPTVSRNITVKVKVPSSTFSIVDQNNNSVYGEQFCVNSSQDDCDLYFETHFDSHQTRHFKLVPNSSLNSVTRVQALQVSDSNEAITVDVSETVKLTVVANSKNQFELKTCKDACHTNSFEIAYDYYKAWQANGQKSGAYIFRPSASTVSAAIPYSEILSNSVYSGRLVTIVTLEGLHTQSQLRVFPHNENVVELETFIDSIPVSDGIGKEIVLHVNTNLTNNQTFYTDSNGLELQKRILNYRPTWNLSVNEPSSGNYYPVNGLITLTGENTRVSVVNDRSQGGTSLKEGQIELMIHRRLLYDDARGVGEPLDETETYDKKVGLEQRVRHFIVFENANTTNSARLVQNNLDNSPLIYQAESSLNNFSSSAATSAPEQQLSLFTQNKSPYVKIYLRPFGEDFLLRLNNLNDVQTYVVRIPSDFRIVEELTLTANQNFSEWNSKKYTWQTESYSVGQANVYAEEHASNFGRNLSEASGDFLTLLISPLQQKAFRVRHVAQNAHQSA